MDVTVIESVMSVVYNTYCLFFHQTAHNTLFKIQSWAYQVEIIEVDQAMQIFYRSG